MKKLAIFTVSTLVFSNFVFATGNYSAAAKAEPLTTLTPDETVLDELDPQDPNIEEKLNQLDQQYYEETGKLPFLVQDFAESLMGNDCYRAECTVWALVKRSEQKLYLYFNGQLQNVWDTSTGVVGHRTPDFDRHPNGRIYDSYSSRKYPGGDYNGLGNMPYAVFIEGGYAIHGTGKSNWPRLGSRASHGCVRVHPDNAFIFNRLVRQYGINQVWVTIQE